MGTLASGSIDLKSLKVAGEGASKYITTIDSNNGIQVHATNNSALNYVQINASGMEIFKTDGAPTPSSISVALFGETIRVGKETSAHINITSGGLDLYKGSTNFNNLISHLGYGSTNDTLGNTSNIPYFTFGTRRQNQAEYTTNYIPGIYSVAEGLDVIALGSYSHAEGSETEAIGHYSHAEGSNTYAIGNGSHAGGFQSIAGLIDGSTNQPVGNYSFVHGDHVKAVANYQTVFGKFNLDDANAMFIIGNGTNDNNRSNLMTVGDNYVRIGNLNSGYISMSSTGMEIFKGGDSIAFYGNETRIGKVANSYARTLINTGGMQVIQRNSSGTDIVMANIGYDYGNDELGGTSISPYYTFGVRRSNSDIGNYSVAEGQYNIASGAFAHAEGYHTEATAQFSHAEGYWTQATGDYAHAEGNGAYATTYEAHAEGDHTRATGFSSHAQNSHTEASGNYSHAGGYYTRAYGQSQTAIGEYNNADPDGNYALIIGNGDSSATSNALTVDWSGGITINNHSSPMGSQVNGTKVDAASTAIPDSVNASSGTGTSIAQIILPEGRWIVYGQARFASNSTGYRRMGFSSTKSTNSLDIQYGASSSGVTQISNTRILSPSSTTTYYLNVTQNSGATLAMSDIVFAAWRLI